MEKIIRKIFQSEFDEKIKSVKEVIGLGQVNKVYEIIGNRNKYIIRVNEDENKKIEYQKEKWCLLEMKSLGIKSPDVIKVGKDYGLNYMILEKINGINGKLVTDKERLEIWYSLGSYAKKYQKIKRIEVEEFIKNEFHNNWKSRADYNIKQLNAKDRLLKNKTLTKKDQENAVRKLLELKGKEWKEGLVHGDLCPRNTIFSKEGVFLIDWGTAEINVTPHHEIGLVLMSGEVNEIEFTFFLNGFGYSKTEYKKIEKDILIFNFLHSLDKYRWAESHDLENITKYEIKVVKSFKKIK